MKNIQSYNSYRRFLEDAFLREKAASRGVTLSRFSARFAMSPSLFKMVLTGERNLTINNVHRIARSLGLSHDETFYFENLVHFEQEIDVATKAYYKKQILHLKRLGRLQNLRTAEKGLIANSLVPAFLMYLIDIEKIGSQKRFDDLNESELSKKFNVPVHQIREMIKTCQAAGVEFQDFKKSAHIIFDKMSHKIGEAGYIVEELREAAKKVTPYFTHPAGIFRAFTLTMETSDVLQLKMDCMDLLESYMAKEVSPKSDRVIEKVLFAAYPTVEVNRNEGMPSS